jgi:hypothetical protein
MEISVHRHGANLKILKGKRPDMPWGGSPFAKAPTEKERAEREALL